MKIKGDIKLVSVNISYFEKRVEQIEFWSKYIIEQKLEAVYQKQYEGRANELYRVLSVIENPSNEIANLKERLKKSFPEIVFL